MAISRLTQQKDLMNKRIQNVEGLVAGYIVHIGGVTVFIHALAAKNFIDNSGKKSINKADALAIGYPISGFTPKRARKERLDIEALIEELKYPF